MDFNSVLYDSFKLKQTRFTSFGFFGFLLFYFLIFFGCIVGRARILFTSKKDKKTKEKNEFIYFHNLKEYLNIYAFESTIANRDFAEYIRLLKGSTILDAPILLVESTLFSYQFHFDAFRPNVNHLNVLR